MGAGSGWTGTAGSSSRQPRTATPSKAPIVPGTRCDSWEASAGRTGSRSASTEEKCGRIEQDDGKLGRIWVGRRGGGKEHEELMATKTPVVFVLGAALCGCSSGPSAGGFGSHVDPGSDDASGGNGSGAGGAAGQDSSAGTPPPLSDGGSVPPLVD